MWAFAERLDGKLTKPQLKSWLEWSYDVQFKFVEATGRNSIFFAHCQERENIDIDALAMRTTTLMRIMQIQSFNAMQPVALAAAALHHEYKTHLRLSPGSEEVSKGFIDSANTIAARMLTLPGVQALLVQCDTCRDSPLNRIAVLQAIVSKARTPDNIAYVVAGIVDAFYNGNFTDAATSVSDYRSGGVIEMYLLKFGLKQYFLGEFLQSQGWGHSVSGILTCVFKDFQSYRSKCGYGHNRLPLDFLTDEHDETFRTALSGSADAFFVLVEEVCFSTSCNDLLSELQSKGLKPKDCMTHGQIKTLADKVLALRQAELGFGQEPASAVTVPDDDDGIEDIIKNENAPGSSSAQRSPPQKFKQAALETISDAVAEKLTAEGQADLDWGAVAHLVDRSLRKCVSLVPGDAPIDELKSAIASSAAGKFVPLRSAESLMNDALSASQPSGPAGKLYRGRVLVIYDISTSGEASARAQYRGCPLRIHVLGYLLLFWSSREMA